MEKPSEEPIVQQVAVRFPTSYDQQDFTKHVYNLPETAWRLQNVQLIVDNEGTGWNFHSGLTDSTGRLWELLLLRETTKKEGDLEYTYFHFLRFSKDIDGRWGSGGNMVSFWRCIDSLVDPDEGAINNSTLDRDFFLQVYPLSRR